MNEHPVPVSDRAGREDDALFLGAAAGATPGIITGESLAQNVHTLPEQGLRARVRGWMTLNESPDLDFWIGSYTAEGKWIYCSSREDRYVPSAFRVDYARKTCRYLNRELACGGAWLVGWIRGGRTFYMLWKDQDGDIQIPIECDKPFYQLAGQWSNEDWGRECAKAQLIWKNFWLQVELKKSQQKHVAAGEGVTPEHMEVQQ